MLFVLTFRREDRFDRATIAFSCTFNFCIPGIHRPDFGFVCTKPVRVFDPVTSRNICPVVYVPLPSTDAVAAEGIGWHSTGSPSVAQGEFEKRNQGPNEHGGLETVSRSLSASKLHSTLGGYEPLNRVLFGGI